jgi:hypothetical protein
MLGRKQRFDDPRRLPRKAVVALNAMLQSGEKIEVIVPGALGSGLVGTNIRGFVWTKGHLYVYPYAEL